MSFRTTIPVLSVLVLSHFGLLRSVAHAQSESPTASVHPLAVVVDLDVGETKQVTLTNGEKSSVKLLDVRETRDSVCNAVRSALVTVEIEGQKYDLIAANYQLPKMVGKVQMDCSITRGNNENGEATFWGLDKAARLRLWPAGSPWISPGTFQYPVKQKWFATNTQMANEPVFVDGGEKPGKRKIYYHSGLDIGGSEGMVEVVAATEGLVVSVGTEVLQGHKIDSPVAPRYDVVYLLDARGWYYRYSHLKSIDTRIALGRVLKMGDPIGILGKEGGSGGWSHLHFEIKSRQPSGKWGTEEGYAYLWEAYQNQYSPSIIAVARPHHLAQTGETLFFDGSKSWSKSGGKLNFEWQFADGSRSTEAIVRRAYQSAGKYSEILKVTDQQGNVAYDFAEVYVYDHQHPTRELPSIHANYSPTIGLRQASEITFKVRTFANKRGTEIWDFGDGSPSVEVHSDGNEVKLAPDGYAATTHRYSKAGDYIATVHRTFEDGVKVVSHLHVHVEPDEPIDTVKRSNREIAWQKIGASFTPPAQWRGMLGDYRSPLKFADGRVVQNATQWRERRAEIAKEWHEQMGDWPALLTDPKVEILESTHRDNFQQLKIRFLWTPTEKTTGYLLIPDGAGKKPAVLTVFYEPETAIGLKVADRDFALQLARQGFVTLSIGTTEATEAKTFSLYYPSIDDAKVEPLSMLGYAAANAWYVLASRPEVDPDRIGIVGHSFGGKWAMFASCLFDKFACAAWSDPGIVFDDSRSNINYWEPWYLGYHPKPWRERGLISEKNPARGAYPRLRANGHDLHELHALMAPRPFLVSGGAEDQPNRWVPLNHSIAVNELLGTSNRVAMTNRPEHAPNAESNAQLVAFFQYFLAEPQK